jgi:hypothetical protein
MISGRILLLYCYCYSVIVLYKKADESGCSNYRRIFYQLHNLLGDNIGTIKTSTENVIDASSGVGLDVNTKKTMCCCIATRIQDKIMKRII